MTFPFRARGVSFIDTLLSLFTRASKISFQIFTDLVPPARLPRRAPLNGYVAHTIVRGLHCVYRPTITRARAKCRSRNRPIRVC